MEPFAVLTIKVFEDKGDESEVQWNAISTPDHREKVIQALESNLEIWKRIAVAGQR